VAAQAALALCLMMHATLQRSQAPNCVPRLTCTVSHGELHTM